MGSQPAGGDAEAVLPARNDGDLLLAAGGDLLLAAAGFSEEGAFAMDLRFLGAGEASDATARLPLGRASHIATRELRVTRGGALVPAKYFEVLDMRFACERTERQLALRVCSASPATARRRMATARPTASRADVEASRPRLQERSRKKTVSR